MSRRDKYSDYDNYLAIKMRQLNCCTIKGDQGDVGPIGPKGLKGAQGATGAQGAQGQKGDAGDGIDLANWIFAVDDPIDSLSKSTLANGTFKVNNGIDPSFNQVTNIEISTTDICGNDMTNWLALAKQGDTIKLLDITSANRYYYYTLNTNDSSGNSFLMDVSGIAGFAGHMEKNVPYIFDYDRIGSDSSRGAQGATGAQGDTGAQGVTGAQGATGAQGEKGDGANLANWKFDNSSTTTSGVFFVNDNVDSSFNRVTQIEIQSTDICGNNMNDWLALAKEGDTIKLQDAQVSNRYYYYTLKNNDPSGNLFIMDVSGIAGFDGSMNSGPYIFDYDSAGSGQAEVEVDKYFFKQPDAPSGPQASFQQSSGQYIEINFDIPASAKLAGTVYSPTDPTVFYTSTNTNENWLPAMNYIQLDASSTALSTTGWTTFLDDVSNPVADARITRFKLYNNLIPAPSPLISGNYNDPRTYTYIDSAKMQYGATYDFRIAYVNNSKVDAITNPINFAYTSASFGAFGPSLPPTAIAFNSTDYNNLTLSGSGSNSVIDASLNFPWSNINPPNGPPAVGYGAIWDASKNSSSTGFKQVGGNTVVYTDQTFNFNIPKNSADKTLENWGPKTITPGQIHPEYYYVIDLSSNPANSSYFQEIIDPPSTFGPTYASAGLPTIISNKLIRIPGRNNYSSSGYTDFMGTSSGELITVTKNGGVSQSLTVRRRDTYASVSGVDFVDALNSIVYTYISADDHKKYYANFGEPVSIPSFGSSPVQSGSYIGIDCSGKEITNFETQIKYDVAVLFDASTNYQFGWAGNSNDQSQTIASPPFSLTTSKVKDLDLTPNKTGYYLGVDVSNVKLDVTLTQFPDVGNNTPAYEKYRWNILQNSIDASEVIRKTSLYYEFYLGHAPTQSISISGLSVSTTPPTLSAVNYFGLKNPSITTSNKPQVQVQYTLNNLNPFWAPLSDPFTVFKFYIDPDNVVDDDIIGNTIINWSTTTTGTDISYNFNETYNVSWNQTNAGDYNSVPYARALGTSPQFGSKDSSTNTNTFSNNIIRTTTTIPYYSSSLNNNTTFGGKKLWWDFVWNNTNDLTIDRIGYVGGLPTGKLFNKSSSNIKISLNGGGASSSSSSANYDAIMPPVNAGVFPDPWTSYDHSQALPNNQLMISSGTIISGTPGTSITAYLNPYTDYSGFYDQQRDYSANNLSGDQAQSWSYGANILYDSSITPITGGSSVFLKWIVIEVDNPNTSGTNQNSNLDISGNNGNTLKLGEDYLLFYMERNYANTPGSYTVEGVGRSYTPWMDCSNKNFSTTNLKTFSTAQSATQKGTGNGAYDTTNTTGHPIKKFGATNRVKQYYRIGLVNGSGKHISKITLTYG